MPVTWERRQDFPVFVAKCQSSSRFASQEITMRISESETSGGRERPAVGRDFTSCLQE